MVYKRGAHWHMDVTVAGVRYREALKTTDRREALALEKKRVSEIHQGKAASPMGREFARKPFSEAEKLYLQERKPHVSERTVQFESERLKPLEKFFGDRPVLRIKAEDIAAYQRHRLNEGISARTTNMETGVLRRILKRAKLWTLVAEDVKVLPESLNEVGRVLTPEQKAHLFRTAGSESIWMVAHCAAVLAVSTTCRGVELRNLRWCDVDLFNRLLTVNRSKTRAGHRTIPLNSDAMTALARLRERAESTGATQPEHYVFPACEYEHIDPTRPQKGWRTAWRHLRQEAATRAGREAARTALAENHSISAAKSAWRMAAAPFKDFRFHDLRHQAITELAESGTSDATVMSMAGHLSRRMLEHYSHVRMAAKRAAVDTLAGGLISAQSSAEQISESTIQGRAN